ncbi:sporulation protein YpjB [Paenibacillus sp. IITD108]|uniref:sporulation protein YpjB n=1 Tax=Paenibacillus sp. IITD108 TaxID=3116649 RepID=UPI002F3F90CB
MRAKIIIFSLFGAVLLAGSFAVLTKSFAAGYSAPTTAAQNAELLEQLEASINKIYEAAVIDNRQAGYVELQKLKKYVERYLEKSTDVRLTGWQQLRHEVERLSISMESGTLAVNWHQQAAKLRLAIDSQIRPQTALWLQYQLLLKEDIALLKKSLYGQSDGFIQAARGIMTSIEGKYDRLKLAGYMEQEPAVIAAVEERIAHTKKLLFDKPYATKEKRNEIVASVDALHTVFISLFQDNTQSIAASVLIVGPESEALGWTLFFGGFIFTVLAFVSWRKYKLAPYGVKPIAKG